MLSIQGTSPRDAGEEIEASREGGSNINHANAANQQVRQKVHVHNWALHYIK